MAEEAVSRNALAGSFARFGTPRVEPWADRLFRWTTALFALALFLLAVVIVQKLYEGSRETWENFGLSFLTSQSWDAVAEDFGALPFLTGTLLTSAMALLIALPVALGIAILLAEYVPSWLRDPLSFLVELLAAIPSIVYGLWGLFVLAPVMRENVNPALERSPLGLLPIFGDPFLGASLLTASVILAIMCVPIIAAMSREVLLAVPVSQREAALALGMTRWEATRNVVLAYGRSGVFSAAILGLGRALGETMAVTMVIGNQIKVTYDYFEPGSTMSAIIANEFLEAASPAHVSALVAVGLALLVMSLFVNVVARLLVRKMAHAGGAGE